MPMDIFILELVSNQLTVPVNNMFAPEVSMCLPLNSFSVYVPSWDSAVNSKNRRERVVCIANTSAMLSILGERERTI